jgi:putative nucleotidyltransferase-like protein
VTQTLPDLRLLLLDLLSPFRESDQTQIAELGFGEWEAILSMAKRHRIEPLLHWQLERAKTPINIPGHARSTWTRAYHQSIMQSLATERDLLSVHRLLDQADFPHTALKGAYLAHHAYPRPWLRPLRDIDILLPKDRAVEAYYFLASHGLSGSEKYPGNVEKALKLYYHLPPLYAPSKSVPVELHFRLFHLNDCRHVDLDLSEMPGFHDRLVSKPVGGEALSFPGAADLLLHLIVHAAYDHQFNNGPLIFSDIAFLLSGHDVDWELFWELAEATRATRGAILTLRVAEHYWGPLDIVWPGPRDLRAPLPDEALELPALLSLSGAGRNADASLRIGLHEQQSALGKAAFLWRKIFRSRASIAEHYQIGMRSPRIYLYYVLNAWRIATRRVPGFIGSLWAREVKQEAADISRLNAWLADPRHD